MSWLITGTQKIDPDAAVYLSRVEAADGQSLEAGIKSAIETFIVGCKTDGNWSAIRASYLLCCARTLTGALIPLVGPDATSVGFVSGNYNRKTGLLCGVGRYLRTGIADDSLPQDNFHMSLFGSFVNAGITTAQAGVYTASTHSVLYQVTNLLYATNRRTGGALGALTPASPCFLGSSRSTSAGYTIRGNQVTSSQTSASVTPSSLKHIACGVNNNGALTGTSASNIMFYSLGTAVDLVALESRLLTLKIDIDALP